MISVLILGLRGRTLPCAAPADVVRTLTALVPATIEGVVRDVQLLTKPGNTSLAHVAEHAGCGLVTADTFAAGLKSGRATAKCPFLLVTQAGISVDRGFIDEIAQLMPVLAGAPRAYLLRSQGTGVVSRLLPRFAPNAALLLPRSALAATTVGGFDALVREARPKPLKSVASLAI